MAERQQTAPRLQGMPHIVAIGGGTGLSTMLRGLKKNTDAITAIVSVADDGGGSGMLRQELKMLPPGDIRSCILALAETEPMMEKLLRYRFADGSLAGQSFGNLLLAAMNGIFCGDFVTAVKNVSEVLKVTGKVLPVTGCDVELVATLANGQTVVGESKIGCAVHDYGSAISRIRLRPRAGGGEVLPVDDVLAEIAQADLITLGPGSLYTSILPNLAVSGVTEALAAAKAPIVYINNIMTQPGETDGYTAFDHAEAILKHTRPHFIDYCIVNAAPVDTPLLSKYIEQDAETVILDMPRFAQAGIQVIAKDLVSVEDGRYIRHNAAVLADVIMDLANKHRLGPNQVSEEGVVLYHPRHRRT